MLDALLDDVLEAADDARVRAHDYDLLKDYDAGRHRARFASDAFRDRYDWLIQAGVVNLCPRIVANFADLVRVESWAGPDAERADEVAAEHGLTDALPLVVREALTCGDAFVNVWPDETGLPRVWFHTASQAGFLPSATNPSQPRAFYQWWTESESPRLNLYSPDGTVTRWIADPVVAADGLDVSGTVRWRPFEDDDQPAYYRREEGLTWTHVAFDPESQGGHGRSLLRDAIPLQDGLNHAYHALLVSTERFARPMRGVLNFDADPKLNPVTGKMERPTLHVDETKDSFIGLNGAGPVFEWSQADPSGLIKIMETYGSWMARTVGMPVTDLVPDLGNVPSGAALRLLSASRTATVNAFTRSLVAPVANVMRLLGVDAQPVFADAAPVDESELWQRAQQRDSLGFPLAENLVEMGWDAERAAQIVEARDLQDANLGAVAARALSEGRI